MIAVLSLTLSFAVAPAVSKVTANYLVSQQVQQMQEEEKNNEGKIFYRRLLTKVGRDKYQRRGYARNVSAGRGKCSCVSTVLFLYLEFVILKSKTEKYLVEMS